MLKEEKGSRKGRGRLAGASGGWREAKRVCERGERVKEQQETDEEKRERVE
jgi:hypothetical protein